MKENKVYLYRLTHDTGFAPCVDNGFFSLVCCKGGRKDGRPTGLRHTIGKNCDLERENIFIAGLYDRKKLLYIAKITEVMSMIDYYSRPKQFGKRYDYIYSVVDGKLEHTGSIFHNDKNGDSQKRDIAGEYALLSDDFKYWGNKVFNLSQEIIDFFPKNRGHSLVTGENAKTIHRCHTQ